MKKRIGEFLRRSLSVGMAFCLVLTGGDFLLPPMTARAEESFDASDVSIADLTELISNPGFESGTDYWKLGDIGSFWAEDGEYNKRTGDKSGGVWSQDTENEAVLSQTIENPGAVGNYVIKAWECPRGDSIAAKVGIRIIQENAKGDEVVFADKYITPSDWNYTEITSGVFYLDEESLENDLTIQLYLLANSGGGNICFDDVSLTRVILNPGFEKWTWEESVATLDGWTSAENIYYKWRGDGGESANSGDSSIGLGDNKNGLKNQTASAFQLMPLPAAEDSYQFNIYYCGSALTSAGFMVNGADKSLNVTEKWEWLLYSSDNVTLVGDTGVYIYGTMNDNAAAWSCYDDFYILSKSSTEAKLYSLNKIAAAHIGETSNWTSESLESLTAAYNETKSLSTESGSLSDIETKLEALAAAINALVEDGDYAIQKKKTELSGRITELEGLVTDTTIYTSETASAYTTALSNAKSAVESEDATVDSLEEALNNLNTAYKALKKAQYDIADAIVNPGFEDEYDDPWVETGDKSSRGSNKRTGNYAACWWSENGGSYTLSQDIDLEPDADGNYYEITARTLGKAAKAVVELLKDDVAIVSNNNGAITAGWTEDADEWGEITTGAFLITGDDKGTYTLKITLTLDADDWGAIDDFEATTASEADVIKIKKADLTALIDKVEAAVTDISLYTADTAAAYQAALKAAKAAVEIDAATVAGLVEAYDSLNAAYKALKKSNYDLADVIVNPGFEDTDDDPWTETGDKSSRDSNKRSGNYAACWWSEKGGSYTLSQDIDLEPDADGAYYVISARTYGLASNALVELIKSGSDAAAFFNDNGEINVPWVEGGVSADDWGTISVGPLLITSDNSGIYALRVTLTLAAGDWGAIDDFGIKTISAEEAKKESLEALRAYINEVKDTDLSDYTAASAKTFTDAIAAAQSEAANNDSTVESLKKALDDLMKAVESLTVDPSVELKNLVEETKKRYAEANYTAASFAALKTAIAEAENLLAGSIAADAAYTAAADKIRAAIDALIWSADVNAGINVEHVLGTTDDDDFARGVDISSYLSLIESGAKFYDTDGNELTNIEFFKLLKASGVNYVRLRVWNDPYDSAGNSYGGGANDLDKAKRMGKLATDAGMRVLIDFHYSDFWADPAKQDAPKAWASDISSSDPAGSADRIAARVYDYTLVSLNELLDYGVDVGMVQVGNETNNGVAGITGSTYMAKVFTKGVEAVHRAGNDRGKTILAVLHFTNPESASILTGAAAAYKDTGYDVFSTSYYPFWHGTIENLYNKLEYIAENYNKRVMVAETSYTTTWDDGDGHGNSAPKTIGQDLDYPVSVQGQATALREVANAVASITTGVTGTTNGRGIGVFYWEPAWIPVQYAYDSDGERNEAIYAQNKLLWETYGSGWASSYAAEYDPDDAGLWYGGSAVDNQSFFDFMGSPLETLNIFNYIQTGARVDPGITPTVSFVQIADSSDYESGGITVEKTVYRMNLGDELKLDLVRAAVTYSDGSVKYEPLTFDSQDVSALKRSIRKLGSYTITGRVSIDGRTWNCKLTVEVSTDANSLVNGDFEAADKGGWTIDFTKTPTEGGARIELANVDALPHGGDGALWFWDSSDVSFDAYQQIRAAAGTYTLSAYIQGGDAVDDNIYLWVRIGDGTTLLKSETSIAGYANWANPTISDITIDKDDTVLTVGIHVEGAAGIWGSIDDFRLLGTYPVYLVSDSKKGTITVASPEAVQGESVIVEAYPAHGYLFDSISVSDGTNNINAADNTFSMPAHSVTVTAVWRELPDNIPMDAVTAVLKYMRLPFANKALKPGVIAVYESMVLEAGTDYTAEYTDNKAVGTAKVKLTGKGHFTGTKELTFEIYAAEDIKDAVVGKVANQEYTGLDIEPELSVSLSGKTLTQGADYRVEYTDNRAIGTASAWISGIGAYTGSVQVKFKIVKKSLTKNIKEDGTGSMTLTVAQSVVYNGEIQKPTVILKDGMSVLRSGRDYTVKYSNTKDAGRTGKITITGKGNYTGKVKREYTITQKPLDDADIEIFVSAVASGGTRVVLPKVRIESKNGVLAAKNHYSLSLADNETTEAGIKKLTITGRGNLSGTVIVDYYCTDRKNIVTNMQISGAGAQNYMFGKRVTLDELKLSSGADIYTEADGSFSVEYRNNINAGRAEAYITGNNVNCAGFRIVKFKIKPVTLTADEAKTMLSAELYNDRDGFGTKVYYTGAAVKPKLVVKNIKTGATLSEGIQYKVSYANNVVPSADDNMEGSARAVIIGKGSCKFTFVKTFRIEPLSLDDLTVRLSEVEYTGKALKPELSFTLDGKTVDLKVKKAYKLSFENNKAVGYASSDKAPQVVITPAGKLKGQAVTKTFTISAAEITEEDITAKSVKYNGSEVVPRLSVKHSGKTLKAGRDYTAELIMDSDADGNPYIVGGGTVIVTGMENYRGEALKRMIVK